MNKEDVLKLSGREIDRETLKEIRECEDVKAIRDNGIDGNHIGKRWYVVVFRTGNGISVYCR